MAEGTPLACAQEEILRLRDLCREAHWALYGLHDRSTCHACEDLRTGASVEPCSAAVALNRLEMAGGRQPPR